MSRTKKDKTEKRCTSQVAIVLSDGDLCVPGYTSLDQNPETDRGADRLDDDPPDVEHKERRHPDHE